MDYKKELEKIVQRCKEVYESGDESIKEQIAVICPQVAQSEEERIINRIKTAIGYYWPGEEQEEILRWLDKKNRWVPRAEQLFALARAIGEFRESNKPKLANELDSLYNDITKL